MSTYPLPQEILRLRKPSLSTTGILHSEFHWVVSPTAAQLAHKTEQDTLNIAI